MSTKKKSQPEAVLRVSTFITYRTPAGAVFEPGEKHPATRSPCGRLYLLTHTTSREEVCFSQTEVCDPKAARPLHEQVVAATKMLTRRRATLVAA